jgi:AraC-like DNA-binding protein
MTMKRTRRNRDVRLIERTRALPEADGTERPGSLHIHRVLFHTLGMTVIDFRCSAGVEQEGPEEQNATNSIVLVRRGVFQRTYRGETLLADANQILFFNKSEPYRFSHPLVGGDECTILAPETPLARELVARHSRDDAEQAGAPFRVSHCLGSRRAARLQYELLARIGQHAPALVVEDVVSELADEAVRAAYRMEPRRTEDDGPSTATRRRHYDLAEAAKLALNASLERLPSLGELARNLGCSAFHLSRTFHSTTGLSLRRYVGRLRVLLAAERLAGGARDITEVALDLGYADHSHLTNTFRREWGLPPSRFRARTRHSWA